MVELQSVKNDTGVVRDSTSLNDTTEGANDKYLSCEILAVWKNGEISFQCRWRINTAANHSEKTFQTVNIRINLNAEACDFPVHSNDAVPALYLGKRESREGPLLEKFEPGAACDFLVDSLRMSFDRGNIKRSAVKLVLPSASGYVARSDFLEWRMAELLALSADGILLKDAPESLVQTRFEMLEAELEARISFPWLLPSPVERRRVVFVDHDDVDLGGGQVLVKAVLGLDLALIVVANPGHWFRKPENSHICEAFLPVDLTADEGLPARIIEAVRGYALAVDGIFTFNELMHIPIAKAAEALSLPTSPITAHTICTDKYATRMFIGVEDPKFQALKFLSGDELLDKGRRGARGVGYMCEGV